MIKRRTALQPLEAGALLVVSQIGPAFFLTPRFVLETGGSSTAYAFLGAAIAGFFGLVFTLRAVSGGDEPSPARWGRIGRAGAGVLLLAFNLLTMTLMLRIVAQFVQTLLYPTTPFWAIVGGFVIAAYLAEITTAVNIARSVQIILFFSLPAYLLANAMLVPRVAYPLDLLPGPLALGLFMNGTARAFLLFWGYDVLYAVASDLHSKRAELGRTLALYPVNVFLMALPSALVVAVFGIQLTDHLSWPLAESFRTLSFSGFLLNRVGVLVVASWSIVVEGALFLRLWAFGRTYAILFGAREPEWAHRAAPVLIGLLAVLPLAPRAVESVMVGLLVPLAWATAFLVPALIVLTHTHRPKGTRVALRHT